jgi:hypothetical protein
MFVSFPLYQGHPQLMDGTGCGNDDLPWLYIQSLQNIGMLKCVSFWVNEFARHLFMDILWQNMDVIVWNV